jgi:hypothetical protein
METAQHREVTKERAIVSNGVAVRCLDVPGSP